MDIYGDGFVLKVRQNIEKEKNANADDSIYINGELIPLVRIELKDQFSILIPQTFVDLPPSLADIKYPFGQKPEIIKTSLDTKVNLTFNLLNCPLNSENSKSSLLQMKMLLQKINPSFVFSEAQEKNIGTEVLAFINFKSFALDNQIYNLLFLMPIGNKTLHSVFNCIYTEKEDWQASFEKMMMSIVDIVKTKENLK